VFKEVVGLEKFIWVSTLNVGSRIIKLKLGNNSVTEPKDNLIDSL
jgi:hypothetical protein